MSAYFIGNFYEVHAEPRLLTYFLQTRANKMHISSAMPFPLRFTVLQFQKHLDYTIAATYWRNTILEIQNITFYLYNDTIIIIFWLFMCVWYVYLCMHAIHIYMIYIFVYIHLYVCIISNEKYKNKSRNKWKTIT